MTKIRKICGVFWKRIYIFLPLMLTGFFGLGYLTEHSRLINLPIEKAELLYGKLTEDMIRSFSVECGCTWAFLFSFIIVLVLLITTLLASEKVVRRRLGIVLIALTILAVLVYWWFVRNFTLTF